MQDLQLHGLIRRKLSAVDLRGGPEGVIGPIGDHRREQPSWLEAFHRDPACCGDGPTMSKRSFTIPTSVRSKHALLLFEENDSNESAARFGRCRIRSAFTDRIDWAAA